MIDANIGISISRTSILSSVQKHLIIFIGFAVLRVPLLSRVKIRVVLNEIGLLQVLKKIIVQAFLAKTRSTVGLGGRVQVRLVLQCAVVVSH